MAMRAEILFPQDMAARGVAMLSAMIDAAPIPVKVRDAYVGDCDLLMIYGNGHAIRRKSWAAHLQAGGRCVGWDLGYWRRELPDASMRLMIDADHCTAMIRPEPASRWDATRIGMREDAGNGHILLIGQGFKSLRVTNEPALSWEMRRLREILAAFPDSRVLYRPKRARDPGLIAKRVKVSTVGTIEQALSGARLVVCRHSNVAVDACIAGVPVVCEAGAAAALYNGDICNIPKISTAQRLAFLQSLAWWNWRPSEAAQAWTYLLGRIRAG